MANSPNVLHIVGLLIAAAVTGGCAGGGSASTELAGNSGQPTGSTRVVGYQQCPGNMLQMKLNPYILRASAQEVAAHEAKIEAATAGRGPPAGFKANALSDIMHNKKVSMADAVTARQGLTRVSHDDQHGTQVTYSTPDGHSYLWYPGNPHVLQGKWQACEYAYTVASSSLFASKALATYGMMCFQYGPDTYNPSTRKSGNQWECGPAGALERRLVDAQPGDVFGLATKAAAPGQLTTERMTIAQLKARTTKPAKR